LVYRAMDQMLNRQVALKVLRPESQLDTEIVERFRREARAGAQLHHRNIVTVYDLGEAEGGVTYIAMELLDGIDLRAAVKKQVPFPVARKIEMVAEVCEGLGHAHSKGIVHRDIKPSNLFLHLNSHIKILDFGIARLATSVLTRTGRILGTPNYMAPEQITGEKCDSRSDLFSAAIVSFEFLAGAHPFQAPFIPRRIVNDEPERLRDINPDFPPELDEALLRAMARDPDDRFQTGEEFGEALRRILETADLQAFGAHTGGDRTFDDESTAGLAGNGVSSDMGGETATMLHRPVPIRKESGG
jgi:eukaryotic-like serine/threonine-protein kinase